MANTLLTQKQENFANNIVYGMSQYESWIAAGYSSNYSRAIIDTNASRLVIKTKVQLRIQELRALVASKDTIMPVQERQERLSSIGRGILTDYVDNNGNIELETNPGALSEVVIEDWKGGKDQRAMSQTKKVKLHNPVSAIQELNKMDGSYAPDKQLILGDIHIEVTYVNRDRNKEGGTESGKKLPGPDVVHKSSG